MNWTGISLIWWNRLSTYQCQAPGGDHGCGSNVCTIWRCCSLIWYMWGGWSWWIVTTGLASRWVLRWVRRGWIGTTSWFSVSWWDRCSVCWSADSYRNRNSSMKSVCVIRHIQDTYSVAKTEAMNANKRAKRGNCILSYMGIIVRIRWLNIYIKVLNR